MNSVQLIRFLRATLLALLCTSLGACATMTDSTSEQDAAGQNPPKVVTTADIQAAWTKASTPTAEHAALTQLTGKWKATTKWWAAPDLNPEVSKSSSNNYMIYGGKFLRQDFSGVAMKQPFKGMGITGFDTVTSKFTSIWLDSMTTALMVSHGDYDATTKTLTLTGEASCAIVGAKLATRSVTKILDRNHYVFEMYTPGPDGKEFKSLEISYSRSK